MTGAGDDREPAVMRATRVATDVAASHAGDVDVRGRFPEEAVTALRREGLLSLMIPRELGGGGADLSTVAACATSLARACGSTALIFAMHHSQVACLVRHGDDQPAVSDVLRRIAAGELLVASATTESAKGGDVSTSLCHVERRGSRFILHKQASVISYGEYADVVLVTARREQESVAHDQVLVICTRDGLALERTGGWDTLGFRGTCSHGYALAAEGDVSQVLTTPFSQISGQTMLPVSHVLWAAVWLGLAEEAVDRARQQVQSAARARPSVLPVGALRLADAVRRLLEFRALVRGAADRAESGGNDITLLARPASVVEFNSLKVSSAEAVTAIVADALAICGITGYQNGEPTSVARLLRDAHGASLMINDDRIRQNTAQLLLAAKTI